MTYGDGSGTYFDVLTSIDVAAHEIGHAVCEKQQT
jgi:Zn-dependent metalloprotease